jgi:enolase-phosphatase E1
MNRTTRAIVLDIEGTVTPISFVHEVLFPYAREKMAGYLREHWNEPAVAAARAMLDAGSAEYSQAALAALMGTIVALMDRDAKSTGLKQLQGMIWDEGYRAGAFRSPLFADVPVALRRWTQEGKTIAIYSSGSIAAQKVFFRHTDAGDLTPLLSGYFDTTTGPKRSAASYTAIASELAIAAREITFISDIAEEVRAAIEAGLRGLIALRPGNAPVAPGEFEQVRSFSEA